MDNSNRKLKAGTKTQNVFYMGIDVGSTTAKIVVLDSNKKLVFSKYVRHNTEIDQTLVNILALLYEEMGDIQSQVVVTGSAGMGLSESLNFDFTQEVIASARFINSYHDDAGVFIDIGGEDSKIIFFDDKRHPFIRMNGNCAGGTGAFIDQMRVLLNLSIEELDRLALGTQKTHSIASRCGVFAKTDIQNLLSRSVPPSEIAASVFHAVAVQTVTTLLQGMDIKPPVIFSGGPLCFLGAMRREMKKVLHIDDSNVILPPHPELTPAIGAALCCNPDTQIHNLTDVIELVKKRKDTITVAASSRLEPLFKNNDERIEWDTANKAHSTKSIKLADMDGRDAFLGIDSGSTTTKIILISEEGNPAFTFYSGNNGDPIDTAQKGFDLLCKEINVSGAKINIAGTSVTGYGEDLIRTAFSLDDGMVETLAHYRAAKFFNKDVSFILDIGGQDMKAIFVKEGIINNIEINEACSSGCGSFIETFAKSLEMDVETFAGSACKSKNPYDLGTRCTVFMNSKIKQCLREGCGIEDISAGLAYSVIRNCFNKVLKLHDTSALGENIVVQGGTFKNPAVHRALEKFLKRPVVRPDICEMMGAYGCALAVRDKLIDNPEFVTRFPGLDKIDSLSERESTKFTCRGCENHCRITKIKFRGDRHFYTGNRCEKKFSNNGRAVDIGIDMTAIKYQLLFDRKEEPVNEKGIVIGIPRVLNMFENFPFWNTLLTEAGFRVQLSDSSSVKMMDEAAGTVMSENICYPAKLVHAHIFDLIHKNVDRIFYPMVRFEENRFNDTLNSFNCPVVAGYPDVIKNSINPAGKGIPFDFPAVVFNDEKLLRKNCYGYLKSLGVSKKIFEKAFSSAIKAQKKYRDEIRSTGKRIVESARTRRRPVIVVAGRPYHCDPLINHGILSLVTSFGADVITEDTFSAEEKEELGLVNVLTQWEYPNRVYKAAHYIGKEKNIEMIQLNSFGCGPDALVMDEARDIIESYGKTLTVIRIDEIESNGSAKLRIRSLIESLRMKKRIEEFGVPASRITTPPFTEHDKCKKIIAPSFAPQTTFFIETFTRAAGYDVDILPEPDRASIDIGLKYVNNEICFPAIICIGDIIKALQSGKYDPHNTAAAITATGGQCRASSYVPLLKKALIKAGYKDVPVIAATLGSASVNEQPGFRFNIPQVALLGFSAVLFMDAIMRLYYAAAVREKTKGAAEQLAEKYLAKGSRSLGKYELKNADLLLSEAVHEFSSIEGVAGSKIFPRIGVVGEIYIKYNPFSNLNLVQWFIDNGVEPSVPCLVTFFLEGIKSFQYNYKNNITSSSVSVLAGTQLAEGLIARRIRKVNSILNNAKFPVGLVPEISSVADKAKDVVSLMHQYGEGWLLPGEAALMASEGINNIVCLQPFACIANHIIAKGMSRNIKELYPDINMLFLDMDADGSDANIFNRLEFLTRTAKV